LDEEIKSLIGHGSALLCAFFWAFGVILFRKSGAVVTPVFLNLFKNIVGLVLLVLTGVVLQTDFFPPDVSRSEVLTLVLSGALGVGVADTVFFVALKRLGANRIAIVDCTYSPSVIAMSLIYLHEPTPPTLIFGAILTVLAVFIAGFEPNTGASKTSDRKALFLAILAVVMTAFSIAIAKPILNKSDAIWVASVRLFSGLVFVGLQVLFSSKARTKVLPYLRDKRLFKTVVPAAIVGTYLGFLFWTLGMKYANTNTASVLNQLSNVLVLPLSYVFLSERLEPRHVIAVILGFGGATLALLR
jgi:drug/metabolite transporter (DMT)-like permease